MELYLQFGHGMMDHSRALLSKWSGGTVILSPRDLKPAQMERLASEIQQLPGGAVLVDPQFYLPHADHARLRSHDYWPDEYETGTFWSGPGLNELLINLATLNQSLGCSQFILPGVFAHMVDDDWIGQENAIVEEASALNLGTPLICTVALSADAARNPDQVHELLEASSQWNVAGYYLVCEHPAGEYLVSDPSWLANVLDLAAGLKLRQHKVILGCCNQQMLIAVVAKVDALASGTWMNVRSFPPEKFMAAYQDEIRTRSVWYYCPQALSEYKLPFLDMALRQGILNEMAPEAGFDTQFVSHLFAGIQPTTAGLTEQAAFRHYLDSLNQQLRMAPTATYDEVRNRYLQTLDKAHVLLAELNSRGVFGQLRDFREAIDVNRSALILFDSLRGATMRRYWTEL